MHFCNKIPEKIENERYQHIYEKKSSTVNSSHKEKIIDFILQSIANGNYFDGLEEKACKAVAYINRFSDEVSNSKIVDAETGVEYLALTKGDTP